ncbi:MAG: S26 family signal peptidase [Halobacteriota archaeon]
MGRDEGTADTDRDERPDEGGRSDTHRPGGPPGPRPQDTRPDPRSSPRAALTWLGTTDHSTVQFLREIVVSLLIVIAVGFILFAISGVWPPLVAVESDSMEPHLQKGDLVLVMDENRFEPEFAVGDTGVVTAEVGAENDYHRFGGPGDVIVYRPSGSAAATPIIHRAHLYVDDRENWYDRADPDVIDANSCEDLAACPAPHAGFITKGDNPVTNDYYDQTRGISTVVEPEWVKGRAVVRIPWVGWIRLVASDLELPGLSATLFAGGTIGVRPGSQLA